MKKSTCETLIFLLSTLSKDNKGHNKEANSSKAAPSSCEQMYDTVDSKRQELVENEELQVYEIPDHEFGMTSTSRDGQESYIYY